MRVPSRLVQKRICCAGSDMGCRQENAHTHSVWESLTHERYGTSARVDALGKGGADRLPVDHAGSAPLAQDGLQTARRSAPCIEIGAETASTLDEQAADLLPLAVIARERRSEIAAGRSERIGKPLRIERRLGDPHADVRPRDEGGVSQENDPAERHPRRFKIENGLKNGLWCLRDQRGDLRRKPRLGVLPQVADQLGPDQRRRDRDAVTAPARVGAHLRQCDLVIDRPEPDELTAAAALAGVVVRRDRNRERCLAFREAEGHVMEDQVVQRGRRIAFLNHATPVDVTGIARLDLRHEQLADGGANAIRADEQLSLGARAVGENGGDAPRVLLESLELHSRAVALRGKRVLERPIDAVPGAEGSAQRDLENDVATALESDARAHLDPDRVVDADADPPHDREELFMDAEAGSAPRQIAAGALEYGDLPPDGAQQVRYKQPAHRSADHQGTRLIHLAPPSFWHIRISSRFS